MKLYVITIPMLIGRSNLLRILDSQRLPRWLPPSRNDIIRSWNKFRM